MANQTRLLLSILIILAGYALSTAAMMTLGPLLFEYPCAQNVFAAWCALPSDQADHDATYRVFAGFLLLFGISLHFLGRNAAPYPFLALTLWLAALAIVIDLISGRPVINSAKIINDTNNILGAVMAASFTLTVLLIRNQAYSLLRLALAVATSFTVRAASILLFFELSRHVYGVTELFLLYVTYAFGSFTIHLMTICGFVAHTPLKARQEARV